MKRLASLGLIIMLGTTSLLAQKSNSTRPNIIYIMSDDHGYQAISAYGYGLNHTPNIDAIANKGMLFTRAYVTNSICGPSRAVMLTGKHSHINGFKDNLSTFNGDQQTVAKLLHSAGYQTAVVGKWHLVSDPQGFDYWNIVPGQGDYYNPDFIENGLKKRIEGYVTNITTDIAINWLQNRDKSKPFFLMYQQKAPHRNWMPEEKYYHLFDNTKFPVPENYFDDYSGKTRAEKEQEMEIATHMHFAYDLKVIPTDTMLERKTGPAPGLQGALNRMTPEQRKKWDAAYGPVGEQFNKAHLTGRDLAIWKYQRYMQDYLRCVQSVDDNVGRLMEYLKANGLDKNTIIIYTSDQGFFLGEHGWFDKRWMYEESFRTPLIISWPGVTKKSTTNSMVQNLDFAETILDMADLPIPSDMQGKSIAPLLKGKQKGNVHDALYYHFYENKEHKVAKHIGVRTDRYKLIYFYENKEWEMYDLDKDKHEMHNVYNDPAYAKVQQMMKEKLKELVKQYKDTVDVE